MNNINITKQELDKLIKSEGIEVYTKPQFDAFVMSNKDIITKRINKEEMSDLEKSESEEVIEEIGSFKRIEVYNQAENSTRIEKSIVFIRPKQVDWKDEIVKSESSEDEKKRTGIYTDTKLNRNLDRVGKVYGEIEKAEEEDLEKAKGEGSRGGKIIGHTKKGKPIYEGSSEKKKSKRVINSNDEPKTPERKRDRDYSNDVAAHAHDGDKK